MEFISVCIGLALVAIICKSVEWWLRKAYVDNITDKYVFITGCDSGFGNQLAKQLDQRGAHVIAACFTEKGAVDLDDATSSRVSTLRLDVTKHESVEEAFETVRGKIPHETALWGVVNNAGMQSVNCPLDWCRREDYEAAFAVNLFGVVDVTLTFLPLLKKSRGRLVNVSSCAGRLATFPGGYVESKFAVEAFSDSVRRARGYFDYRYQVSIIEPGFFLTDLVTKENLARRIEEPWQRLSSAQKEEFPQEVLKDLTEQRLNFTSTFASRNTKKVIDAMEHALFARWPQTRYAVGWDAKLLWLPLSYFPTTVADFLTDPPHWIRRRKANATS